MYIKNTRNVIFAGQIYVFGQQIKLFIYQLLVL